jgi:hypothetical protein
VVEVDPFVPPDDVDAEVGGKPTAATGAAAEVADNWGEGDGTPSCTLVGQC